MKTTSEDLLVMNRISWATESWIRPAPRPDAGRDPVLLSASVHDGVSSYKTASSQLEDVGLLNLRHALAQKLIRLSLSRKCPQYHQSTSSRQSPCPSR